MSTIIIPYHFDNTNNISPLPKKKKKTIELLIYFNIQIILVWIFKKNKFCHVNMAYMSYISMLYGRQFSQVYFWDDIPFQYGPDNCGNY